MAQSPGLKAPKAAVSRQNKDFPRLVLLNMACFCDPWQMLRLARVNKAWYEAFTSDDAWRDWDAYSVETGICSHYLGLRDPKQDGSHLQFGGDPESEPELESEPLHLYYRLCTYRTYGYGMVHVELAPISYPFAKLLAKRPLSFHPSFKNFVPSVVEDEELVIELLKMGVLPGGLPNSYKTNRRAALASISYRSLNGYYARWIRALFGPDEDLGEEDEDLSEDDEDLGEKPAFFYEVFKDDVEFALDAIERDTACYYILADEVKRNTQACDRWIELLHLQLPTARTFSANYTTLPWEPTLVLSDKSRAIKLISLYPTLYNDYAGLCRDGKIDADEDVVFAAVDKDVSGKIGYFPPALMRKREFVLELLKRWPFFAPWESIPLYLRFDTDFLASTVKKLQQRWQDETHVAPTPKNRPGLECIAALFLCEYPLDINKDLDTLLQILSLPDDFLDDFEEAKDKIYFHRDDLARHLLAKVGVKYGLCSKKPRLE